MKTVSMKYAFRLYQINDLHTDVTISNGLKITQSDEKTANEREELEKRLVSLWIVISFILKKTNLTVE